MNIAQEYIEGLKKAYHDNGLGEEWDAFAAVMHGADKTDLETLQKLYPEMPESLIQLLSIVDGTYWREYEGKQYGIYFLGSDLEEYPYYLLSSQEMTDIEDFDWLKDYIDREFGEDVEIDELRVGALPQKEVRHPLLSAGPDDQIRGGLSGGVQVAVKALFRQILRLAEARPHIRGKGPGPPQNFRPAPVVHG